MIVWENRCGKVVVCLAYAVQAKTRWDIIAHSHNNVLFIQHNRPFIWVRGQWLKCYYTTNRPLGIIHTHLYDHAIICTLGIILHTYMTTMCDLIIENLSQGTC